MVNVFDRYGIEQIVCFDLCFDKSACSEDNADRAACNDRPLAGSLEPFEKAIMWWRVQSFEFLVEGCVGYCEKLFCIEGSATDESAIDVRLCK